MLKVNDKLPQFKAKALLNDKEVEINSKDFSGKKIIIYFYPKDMTPGCTTQAQNLRDNIEKFNKEKITIIGISPDPISKHIKFQQKEDLPFYLISDEDKIISNLFGVWGEKSFMGKKYMGVNRTTFLIDENQKITHVIEKPKVKEHSQEIFKLLNL